MALSIMIIFIVCVFTLFTYFICCYGAEEEKKRYRYNETPYPRLRHSFENVRAVPVSHAPRRSPNIGFNVTDGPSRIIPPVGMAPSAPSQFTTPYPPNQPPYPVVQSHIFPTPQTTRLNPSAPVDEISEPPSYYDATHNKY